MQNLEYFFSKAEDALDNAGKALADLSSFTDEFVSVSIKLEMQKHLIESKKNNLIASGSIVGKNADERSASMWIAIPEYDTLIEYEVAYSSAKNKVETAQNNLSYWNSALEMYNSMIKALS